MKAVKGQDNMQRERDTYKTKTIMRIERIRELRPQGNDEKRGRIRWVAKMGLVWCNFANGH